LREEKQDPRTQPVTRRDGNHRDLGIGFEISVPKNFFLSLRRMSGERTEERGRLRIPLSLALSPLVPRGAREKTV